MTTNIFATMTFDQQDALAADFERDFGVDWEAREGFGDRFLSERDFAPDVEIDGPSDEDMQAWLEMSWVDPAERDLG